MAQVVKHLPIKHEVLSSNPRIERKKERGREEGREEQRKEGMKEERKSFSSQSFSFISRSNLF
jgi:predicted transposase YdaD